MGGSSSVEGIPCGEAGCEVECWQDRWRHVRSPGRGEDLGIRGRGEALQSMHQEVTQPSLLVESLSWGLFGLGV